MRKFFKTMLVLVIIALFCVILYGVMHYFKENNATNSNVNNSTQNSSALNELQNNIKTENENTNLTNNKENEENKSEKENQEENNEKVDEQVSLNDEDKAIELAKKEYGETSGVYFRIEQTQSNGIYIVSVRDSETTKDLAWYTVNVKNSTVK